MNAQQPALGEFNEAVSFRFRKIEETAIFK